MSKKTRDNKKRARAWNRYYEELIATERAKVKGYEELAQIHSAYIIILLKKLGATEDNMVTIKPAEIVEAMQKYEARAVPAEGSFSLYCEVVAEE